MYTQMVNIWSPLYSLIKWILMTCHIQTAATGCDLKWLQILNIFHWYKPHYIFDVEDPLSGFLKNYRQRCKEKKKGHLIWIRTAVLEKSANLFNTINYFTTQSPGSYIQGCIFSLQSKYEFLETAFRWKPQHKENRVKMSLLQIWTYSYYQA